MSESTTSASDERRILRRTVQLPAKAPPLVDGRRSLHLCMLGPATIGSCRSRGRYYRQISTVAARKHQIVCYSLQYSWVVLASSKCSVALSYEANAE